MGLASAMVKFVGPELRTYVNDESVGELDALGQPGVHGHGGELAQRVHVVEGAEDELARARARGQLELERGEHEVEELVHAGAVQAHDRRQDDALEQGPQRAQPHRRRRASSRSRGEQGAQLCGLQQRQQHVPDHCKVQTKPYNRYNVIL